MECEHLELGEDCPPECDFENDVYSPKLHVLYWKTLSPTKLAGEMDFIDGKNETWGEEHNEDVAS